MKSSTWFLYIIECTDGSLYTGITVDVEARYAAHCQGTGARYTRSHPPRRLLGFDRDRILEIAEHDINLSGELADLGADLLQMRRHEMDHPLQPQRQFEEGLRRADRERAEELARRPGRHRRLHAAMQRLWPRRCLPSMVLSNVDRPECLGY